MSSLPDLCVPFEYDVVSEEQFPLPNGAGDKSPETQGTGEQGLTGTMSACGKFVSQNDFHRRPLSSMWPMASCGRLGSKRVTDFETFNFRSWMCIAFFERITIDDYPADTMSAHPYDHPCPYGAGLPGSMSHRQLVSLRDAAQSSI